MLVLDFMAVGPGLLSERHASESGWMGSGVGVDVAVMNGKVARTGRCEKT